MPKPPRQKGSAAKGVGSQRGANRHGKADSVSEETYKALARLDAIANYVGPDDLGLLPSSALWAIALADDLATDSDFEPSLGWGSERQNTVGKGPPPILDPVDWQGEMLFSDSRATYQRRHCEDREDGDDHIEPDQDDEPLAVPIHMAGGGADFSLARFSRQKRLAKACHTKRIFVRLWDDEGDLTEEWFTADGKREFAVIAVAWPRCPALLKIGG